MKRNFVVSLFGSLVGFGMLFILLSAAGIVGARGADVRSDVSRANEVSAATPLTSTFTYQGQLISNSVPINALCDFQFSLYDALSVGNRIGLTQTVSSVSVSRGLFTALLNAGNEFGDTAFNGDMRWLSIAVRCPTGGAYTPLIPRQPLTSLPFALPGLRTLPNAYSPNIIGGYSGNFISATVGAGTIGGGGASGSPNRVQASEATIGGGVNNTASGMDTTVSGGVYNTASDFGATVGGGFYNNASGNYATVGGGSNNTASGNRATVPGGYLNTALGAYSFAAGYRAKANHAGAFVWGDSTAANIASTAPNQFLVRASGGITLYTDAAATIGAVLPAGSSSWGVVSDRNAKANFAAVDDRAVLDRLASIPVQTWNYKTQDASIRHIGPMAQDFYAAFQVGENNTTISTVDAQGVALAAIQGLYQQNQELKAQNASLETRLTNLEQNTQPVSFNWFNLIGLIALAISGLTLLKMQRQLKQAGRS